MAILQLEDRKIYKVYGLAIATVLASLKIGVERISLPGDQDLNQVLEKDILNRFETHQVLQTTNYLFDLLKKRDGYQRRDLMVLHPGSPSLYPFLLRSDRWHTHTHAEGLYILSGECILSFIHPNGTPMQLLLQPGDYVKIPERLPHRFSLSASLNLKAVQYSFTPEGCIPDFVRYQPLIMN